MTSGIWLYGTTQYWALWKLVYLLCLSSRLIIHVCIHKSTQSDVWAVTIPIEILKKIGIIFYPKQAHLCPFYWFIKTDWTKMHTLINMFEIKHFWMKYLFQWLLETNPTYLPILYNSLLVFVYDILWMKAIWLWPFFWWCILEAICSFISWIRLEGM